MAGIFEMKMTLQGDWANSQRRRGPYINAFAFMAYWQCYNIALFGSMHILVGKAGSHRQVVAVVTRCPDGKRGCMQRLAGLDPD